MGQYGIGQSIKRFEDPRLVRGEGRFHDDVNLPGQAYVVVVRSLHAHARIVSIDTAAAAAAPGVARGLHGRRPGAGQPRHDEDDAEAQAPGRLADVCAAAPRADAGPRPLRRRPHRARDRRDAGPGRGRGRAGPRRVRAAAVGDVHRGGRRRRPGVGRVRRQHLEPLRGRRQGGGRGRLRARGPRRPAPLRDHARARAVHGAARRARRLRSGRGPLHAPRGRPVPAPRAERAREQHLPGARAPDPRHRGRRRRRLRHQGLAVPRAQARAVGGAQARPARQVAVRAPRGDPGRRARAGQRQRRRAGAGRRRALPRHPRPDPRQRRRLRLLRPQPARDLRQRGDGRRRLHLPRRPRRRSCPS